MGAGVDWTAVFFQAGGRLARGPFLFASALLLIAGGLYEAVAGSALHWLTGWVVYPALIYCGACVLAKRLHDRGRSGWWSALVLFALAGLWPQSPGGLGVAFALVLAWAVVELGAMPGEEGTNRFGTNPLRPAPAAVV
ncbi:MAG: DUF805 domain-containing protein [Phenylobacterium sp.]|uniref:DUF805 domain-containing protein n=1 Tax=Phenylobacterium sp. TaxID=1871053 RepID=UPI0027375ED9|nr:DUF805 domain-containing protein [Phenylobacterium sp.]MDP3173245.1 DUF805 domain-containing protein [Phenylobacterium sp.]